jgi:hypothetical protein
MTDHDSLSFTEFGLRWKQQPAENMYPIIKQRLETNSTLTADDDLNRLYREQVELFNVFHRESGVIKRDQIPLNMATRRVRFCLNCKMYYKTTHLTEDTNINLCSTPCWPNEIEGCIRKLLTV